MFRWTMDDVDDEGAGILWVSVIFRAHSSLIELFKQVYFLHIFYKL